MEDTVDVLHHDVGLELALEPVASLSGRARVRVRARSATPVIVLDAKELVISSVASTSEGAHKPLRFRHVDNRLCIELPRKLVTGADAELDMTWTVPLTGSMPKVSSRQIWAGYRASAWMPTRQDPAQRATLTLRISAPAALKVVASGRRLMPSAHESGRLLHTFKLELPSPPFLYAFAAGDFEELEADVDNLHLRLLGPKRAELAPIMATTSEIYRALSRRIGVPLPAGEYTQVFVQGDAAQEAAGLAIIGESALSDMQKDPSEDWVFSHELAHQWFAWLVPCADFADFWLNEGFATFMTAVVKEQRWGQGAYEREIALLRERSAKVHVEGRDAPLSLSDPAAGVRRAPKDSELQARGVTYSRGALVLHKLRAELGEETFWAGIQQYVKDRATKGARTEHLRRALETVSGRDLSEFFARWVYAPAFDF